MSEIEFQNWEKKLPRSPLVDRDLYIIERCSERRVIHLGACDYPMTEEKAFRGQLLHQLLQGHCKSLIGYDVDEASVGLLREKFGITDIVVRDLSLPPTTVESAGDLIICADIIEHVNNVGHLMMTCNRMLDKNGSVLISTIHALSLKQAIRGFFAREPVHPDHVAYYSYATLGVLLERFGFEPTECRYFKYPTVGRLSGAAFDALYKIAPQSADGIVVEARKKYDV